MLDVIIPGAMTAVTGLCSSIAREAARRRCTRGPRQRRLSYQAAGCVQLAASIYGTCIKEGDPSFAALKLEVS